MSKFLPIGTKGELLNSDMIARIIPKEDGGCIILTKDLLLQDGELDMKRISQLNCKVFRLKKAPNFVQGDLSTIRTQVIEM